jgi:hypothetical protein
MIEMCGAQRGYLNGREKCEVLATTCMVCGRLSSERVACGMWHVACGLLNELCWGVDAFPQVQANWGLVYQ